MVVTTTHLLGGSPKELLLATTNDARFEDAFKQLFLLAFRAAFRILRDTPAAEDVAADTLARLQVRWARLGTVAHRDAWVVRTATNRALDVVRRRPPPSTPHHQTSFEEQVTSRIALVAGLQRLSRRQREAVALRFLVGLTEEEVGRVLGIEAGSVHRHVHRGLRRLRNDLTAELERGDR